MILDDLVSCIILSYKKFDYLYQAIDSVLIQDYSNIELIIFDDGSPNFNRENVVDYIKLNSSKNISNLVVHSHKNNLGTVKNFNLAIEISQGKYLIPLASDDVFFDKNILSNIVIFFKSNNFLLATAYRDLYSENLDEFKMKCPISSIKSLMTDSLTLYKNLCLGNFISGSCTYYTKDFFEKDGLFDETYFLLEDYPKYLSFSRKGGVIGFIDLTTIKYRDGGISSNDLNPKLEHDINLALKNEILSYKKMTGLFVYRHTKYLYNRRIYRKDIFKKVIYNFTYTDVGIYLFLRYMKKKIMPDVSLMKNLKRQIK